MSWIDWAIKILRGRSMSDVAAMNDTYRKHIEYLKQELSEKIKIIDSYKARHPENGVEFNEWKAEAEASHLKQVKLLKENRDLKERLIFLEQDLKKYKKKHRGMYE